MRVCLGVNVPDDLISSQTATAYVHGYLAGYNGKEPQLYGGKLTKAAYMRGMKDGTDAHVAEVETSA